MGPDGEDVRFLFLAEQAQGLAEFAERLQAAWPTPVTTQVRIEIANGLSLVRKLLACDSSYKFIEQFNSQKADLLDVANNFNDLEQFYEHQKPTWEKLRKAFERFQLNRLELEKEAQAGPALTRMQEILAAPSPYSLIKEAEG